MVFGENTDYIWILSRKKTIPNAVKEKFLKEAEKAGDKATAEAIKAEMERLGKAYKKDSRALADRLKEGPLYEFLDSRFPRSYQKKLPDGKITTV